MMNKKDTHRLSQGPSDAQRASTPTRRRQYVRPCARQAAEFRRARTVFSTRPLALIVACVGLTTMFNALGATAMASRGATNIRHHHVHRQALLGSLRRAHVNVVAVVVKGGRGGGVDPGDDYPSQWKNRAMDSVLDQWREYNRECTSFVAWALYSRNGFNMPFYDNANNWGPDAAKRGVVVDRSPAAGSVAWSNAGTYGHVAYVVAVSGGSVTVEEYNHAYNGTYDKRTAAASSFTGYIHFKDIPTEPSPPATAPPTAPVESPSHTPAAVTPTSTESNLATSKEAPHGPPPPPTYPETTGGVTHTWTNYTNAGGTAGPTIAASATVQIACRLQGFRVADGNTWWYRIAASPWAGNYYASADAFYNNGATSGSLKGTPFVDGAVPSC